jgi:hypothetical protein
MRNFVIPVETGIKSFQRLSILWIPVAVYPREGGDLNDSLFTSLSII